MKATARRGRLVLVLAMIAGTVGWWSAPPAGASPVDPLGRWVVASVSDIPDADGVGPDCASVDGECTLRAALQMAEWQLAQGATAATIVFDPSLFGSTITKQSGQVVDVPAGATLSLVGPTTLTDRPTISGGTTIQPLSFTGGGTVEISGIIVADGQSPGAGGAIGSSLGADGLLVLERVSLLDNVATTDGGGVAASNDLTVVDSQILRNQAGGGALGAGISVGAGSTLRVERSTIAENAGAGVQGGAIGVAGGAAVRVTESILRANDANVGGAIWCGCDTLDVERVSVVGNTAASGFAGIAASGATRIAMSDSTLTGNTTTGTNAAVYANTGEATLTNVTITGNAGLTPGPGAVYLGGSPVTVRDSIIAGNTGAEDECTLSSPTIEGTNFLDATCALTGTPAINGTVDNALPALDPLVDDAGGVLTGLGDPLPVLVPSAGSAAIGVGTCTTSLDGRALPRPSSGCDVGAVERDPAVAGGRVFTVDTAADAVDDVVGDGVCLSVVGGCTLRAAIQEADATAATSTITFAGVGAATLANTIPDALCTTTVVTAFCGDFDIRRATLTIRGVDTPGAPATADHQVRVAPLDGGVFDVFAPSVVIEDLGIAGSFVQPTVIARGSNTRLVLRDLEIEGGSQGAVLADPSGDLVLDEVRLSGVADNDAFWGAVRTSRTTRIVNSLIDGATGGAIYSTDGALDLVATVITNSSNVNNTVALVECTQTCGPLTMIDSAVVDNAPPAAPAVSTGDQRATIVSSTIADNVQTIGAVAVGPGGLDLRSSTITGNVSGGSPGRQTGGLRLFGAGPVTVQDSIVRGNTGQAGALGTPPPPPDDCVGDAVVTLVGVNAFPASSPDDCVLAGAAPFTGAALTSTTPSLLQPPRGDAAYGATIGFTELAPALVDAIPAAECTGAVNPLVRPASGGAVADQRGVARPAGPGCEPGAVEIAYLRSAPIVGTTDVTSGASEVTTDAIDPGALRASSIDGEANVAGVGATELRAIDLDATPLRQVPLRQVPLGALATDSELLDSISLAELPLTYTSTNGTGWTAYLLDQSPTAPELAALATQPLNTVMLGQVIRATLTGVGDEYGLPGLDLGQIDFSATPLGSLPLGSLALGAASLTDIDGRAVADGGIDWCGIVGDYADVTCGPGQQVDPATATLVTINLLGVPLRQVPLRQVPLRQVDLSASPLRQVPLRQVEIEATPLRQVPLRQVLIDVAPLRQVPLRQVDLLGSPLRQVPLRQVLIEGSPLRQVPLRQVDLLGSPLRQVPLRQVSNLASIVDCTQVDCASQTLTLGDVVANVLATATLGLLVEGVAATVDLGTLGDIGGAAHPDAYGSLTLGDLVTLLAATVDLGGLGEISGPAFPAGYGELTLGDLLELVGDDPAFLQTTLGDIGGSAYPDAYGDEVLGAQITVALILAVLQAIVQPGDPLYDATLGDLLAGILPASEYPWQQLDLTDPSAVQAAATGTQFHVPMAVALPVDTVIEATITLPPGWRLTPSSLTLQTTTQPGTPPSAPTGVTSTVDPASGRTTLTASFVSPQPAPDRLSFEAVPSLQLTSAAGISAELDAPEWNLTATPVATAPATVRDAFEPVNDTVGTPVSFGSDPDSRVFLTHIGTATDVDWFRLAVPQGTKVSAYLANLPADYDLVLFGPAPAPLRGVPSSSLPPSPDGGLSLIAEDNATTAQVAADIDTTPPTANLRLFGASTRRGVGDERIDTDALPVGTYFLRVSGFNGAHSTSPYSLRVKTAPSTVSGECTFRPGPLPPAPTLAADVTQLTDSTNTVILTHLGRLARGHADAATAVSAMERFVRTVNADPAAYAGVVAAVVPLDDVDAFAAWDADPCDPAAANAVVRDIGSLLDDLVAAHPTIRNVVLVGADDQIPFARVQDAVPAHNESEYAVTFDGSSPLSAAQSLGYVLTDNPYGASNPVAVGPRELFVPELAVGRLVESPDDIDEALQNFLDFHGVLDASTALSTGYDFLSDGAAAVARELEVPRGPVADVAELIGDTWRRADLVAALVTAGPDLASVNAHFDHYRAVPADQDGGLLTDPLELADVVTPERPLDGSVIFSMGCHAGLSVSDVSVGGPLAADWAQTFASQGAVFAGNSGYGYGDDKVVGATEELMRLFASRLDGSLTVGEAMTFAKQRYRADLLVASPFDEKVLNQVVLYGLPMFRLGTADPVAPPTNPPAVTDPATGLPSFETTVVETPTVVPLDDDGDGTPDEAYYETSDGYLATPYQPVQPRFLVDVTQDGEEARGALITDLSSTDVPGVDPVYVTPTDDVTGTNPEANVDGVIFPSVPQQVTSFVDPTGERDQLVLAGGQFIDDPTSTSGDGTQRLFDRIEARVFYAPPGNTDTTQPTIESTSAVIVGGAAAIEVRATDAGGIEQVLVLLTDAANPGDWTAVQLAESPAGSGRFVAGAPVPSGVDAVDYLVQVVDTGGNVGVSSNKGALFAARVAPPPPPPPPTAPTITLPGTGEVTYPGPVTVTITPGSAGGPVNVQVDGGTPTTDAEVTVTGAGPHVVTATGPDGTSTTVRFVIAPPTPASVVVSVDPPASPTGWYRSPPTVTISATGDVTSISTSTDLTGVTTTPGATAVVGPITPDGRRTVSWAVSTGPRSTPTSGSVALAVDTTAPSIAPCPAIADATFLLNEPGATLTLGVTDATSGVPSPTVSAAVPTGTAGMSTVELTATDVAGNTAARTCQVAVTYRVTGFSPPVAMGGTLNRVKAGSTVPLTWRITDAAGTPISDPTSFVGLSTQRSTCDGAATSQDVAEAIGTSGLQYLGDGTWKFNWKTSRSLSGCQTLRLALRGDTDALVALFTFR